MNPEAFAAFQKAVAAAPKTETHLHIEGAVPYALLQSLDREEGMSRYAAPPPSWERDFRFDSFAQFDRALLSMVKPWFKSPERYHIAAKQVFMRLAGQGVRYAEVSFASGIVEFLGVDGRAIAEAIHAAADEVAKATEGGLEVRVFMGLHHNGCPPKMERVLGEALGWRALDGVDLHGDETLPLEPWTGDYWHAARRAGKWTKAHAGELCGGAFIRRVIEELGVRQIEHGVRAAEDPELVAFLARERIVLDVCPTSNVKLRVVDGYRSHPLQSLLRAGVLCTLNSDDPVVFGHDLRDEYAALTREMAFAPRDVFALLRNGWQAANIPEPTRRSRIAEIDALEGV